MNSEFRVGRHLTLARQCRERIVVVAARIDRGTKREVPLVVDVSLGREHVREHLSNDASAELVESNLNATVATTNEQLVRH